jgi:hypothetical protein
MIVGYGALPCFVPMLMEIENMFALFQITMLVCSMHYMCYTTALIRPLYGLMLSECGTCDIWVQTCTQDIITRLW